ncbi:inositol polyphosphate 1-phosphatase isoform X2 [Ranitomeya variabilis]|uniref:inositol polyphosphate 1-phosphatase isoform X2 n=1 Tax=Ranitomeya variabilis TaxID=490064 RepID=UPI0040577054
MSEILQELLSVSEKAAGIARACRQEEALFQLLIEEKKEDEKNKKFLMDFKTLADVLIQEVIKHDLGKKFPGLEKNVRGEESNEFTNELDSTYQYIKGLDDVQPEKGIYPKGLQCVTVLIGVFLMDSGHSVMGVINQPFAIRDPRTFRWKGQWYWGLSYMGNNICSLKYSASTGKPDNKVSHGSEQRTNSGKYSYATVTSSAEAKHFLRALSTVCGENLHFAAGAGYKCLCVIQGFADFYVFSEDTTFKWDSCAAHAILKSLGGGMLDLSECIKSTNQNVKLVAKPHLLYNSEVQGAKGADRWANKGGLVAYRSEQHLEVFMNLFMKELSLPKELH